MLFKSDTFKSAIFNVSLMWSSSAVSEMDCFFIHVESIQTFIMFLDYLLSLPNTIVWNDFWIVWLNAIVHWTYCRLFFKTMILKPSNTTLHHTPPFICVAFDFPLLRCQVAMWMPGLQTHHHCSDPRRHNGPRGVISARMMCWCLLARSKFNMCPACVYFFWI